MIIVDDSSVDKTSVDTESNMAMTKEGRSEKGEEKDQKKLPCQHRKRTMMRDKIKERNEEKRKSILTR